MDARRTLPDRSLAATRHISTALRDDALHISVGTFLDLRYLVDSGRRPAQLLDDARSVVAGDAVTLVSLDLPILDAMAAVPRDQVPDPFDRIIAATALAIDLPLVTVDEAIQGAIGGRAVW